MCCGAQACTGSILLPGVKGCKNHFASFAVRLCFPLLNTYVPASQLSTIGQPKLTGCSANSTEGSSSQLPLAATAGGCLSGWLVADLYITGSEWGFCVSFMPLCTTEVRDKENGNILPVVDIQLPPGGYSLHQTDG